ncbi:hypothetical protein [Streptomyces griseorubiginosus]|nr:hypothetical protein [Streptomyces griseorubiginosus]
MTTTRRPADAKSPGLASRSSDLPESRTRADAGTPGPSAYR